MDNQTKICLSREIFCETNLELKSRMMARPCLLDDNDLVTKSRTPVVKSGDTSSVQTACDVLSRGGVVALPTDTIYGGYLVFFEFLRTSTYMY